MPLRLTTWLRCLLARRRLYRDFSAEIQAHFDEKIDELVAGGMTRREAEAAAKREFGNPTLIEQHGREAWQWPSLEYLLSDARFATRILRKSPGFAIVVVLTLALSIGASVALFTIVYGAFLHPFLNKTSDRAVLLRALFPYQKSKSWMFSATEFLELRNRNHIFENLVAEHEASMLNLSVPPRVDAVWAARLSAESLQADRVTPLLGRTYTPEEDRPGGPPVTVLSWELWQSRFQADRDILGKTIQLSGQSFTVIGVMPRRYRPMGAELWLPLQLNAADTERSHRFLFLVAHLADGVDLEHARRELRALAHSMEKENASTPEYAGWSLDAYPIRDVIVGDLKPALFLLLGAVGLIVLISSANLASLMLVRATARRREIAIRLLHGAGRWRIVRQSLIESAMLGLAGGALGVLFAYASLATLLTLIPRNYIATEADIRMEPVILAGGVLLGLLAGLLIGIAPALETLRGDAGETLQESGRGLTAVRSSGWQRHGLVMAEIALAVVVLAGAALMVRSYLGLAALPLGFHPENVTVMHLSPSAHDYPTAQKTAAFYTQLVRQLEGRTESAAVVSQAPMEGWDVDTHDVWIEGRAMERGGLPNADERIVSPEYFRTLKIGLLEGRVFTSSDREENLPVAIVNETMARMYWPGKSAVGRRIRLGHGSSRARMLFDTGADAPWLTIVGVVKDTRQRPDLTWEIRPEIDLPIAQSAGRIRDMAVVVRNRETDAVALVRREVSRLDAGLPVHNIAKMDEIVADGQGPRRLAVMLLVWFAAMALLLVIIGVYGVMAYSIGCRTQEMGLRMALGAVSQDIVRLILAQATRITLAGIALGIAAALALTRLMAGLLYAVSATDPLTLGGVACLLWAAGLASSYAPLRRATRVDPMVVLRHE